MKRLLITGGSGLLGDRILRVLARDKHGGRVFFRSTDRRILRQVVGEQVDRREWPQGVVIDAAAIGATHGPTP